MAGGIKFFSKLSSLVANATFFIKNTDFDTIISRVVLNNGEVDSGPQIDNTQQLVNQSYKKVIPFLNLAGNAQLTLDRYSTRQLLKVKGDAGAITLDNIPFGTVNLPPDGTEIMLTGYDAVLKVRVLLNDVDFGCLINDHADLGYGHSIKLVWHLDIKRFVEEGRNF